MGEDAPGSLVGVERGISYDSATDTRDQPSDCSGAMVSSRLWPPNHRPARVTVNSDGDPVAITITGIFEAEPTGGVSTGHLTPDGFSIGIDTALVRVERADEGNGRVCHISFSADDAYGGTGTRVGFVGVPARHGHRSNPRRRRHPVRLHDVTERRAHQICDLPGCGKVTQERKR